MLQSNPGQVERPNHSPNSVPQFLSIPSAQSWALFKAEIFRGKTATKMAKTMPDMRPMRGRNGAGDFMSSGTPMSCILWTSMSILQSWQQCSEANCYHLRGIFHSTFHDFELLRLNWMLFVEPTKIGVMCVYLNQAARIILKNSNICGDVTAFLQTLTPPSPTMHRPTYDGTHQCTSFSSFQLNICCTTAKNGRIKRIQKASGPQTGEAFGTLQRPCCLRELTLTLYNEKLVR